MADFDAIVIGAGVVGLATAAALGRAGLGTLVLERAGHIGDGISSRNSEVIHAGLYYPTGSLKHRLCLRGRHLLYDFLATAGLPVRKCGKIVVATAPSELPGLEALARRAEANGVEGIALLDGAGVRALEPEVTATAGLHSPETGIFDSHAFLLALLAQIEDRDGVLALHTPFLRAEAEPGGFRIVTGGEDPAEVTTRLLVNAAGLSACAVAAAIAGRDPATVPPLRFARGCYFGLTGRAPFHRLVYPAPVDGGLGVHATLDLAGRVRFGPDVEWLPAGTAETALDYRVDEGRAASFYAAIRRYWPALPAGALVPDYSGIRPKLSPPGAPAADFRIETEAHHGVPGLVNLMGIESPGLTASLALAEAVAEALAI